MTSCECGWPVREEGMSRYVCDNPNHSAEARCGMAETKQWMYEHVPGSKISSTVNLNGTVFILDELLEAYAGFAIAAAEMFQEASRKKGQQLDARYWAGARAAREQLIAVLTPYDFRNRHYNTQEVLGSLRALRLEGEPEPEVR